MTSRRSLSILLATALFAPSLAWAQTYPERPVKLVVPFAPGGSTDMVARLLADQMGPFLGQAVVVENKGGSGGALGADAIAKAKPDGYTIGMATVSTHGSNPAIYARLPYDPIKDFQPITNVMSVPSVFVVHPGVPARTMPEFIALAKAAPGKYTFASPGNGSLGHANIENFMELAGIQLLHVPYKGAGQAMNDALAGTVDAMTDNLPSSLPHIKNGKMRALAVLSPERSPVLPDVPTYRELGFPEMSEGGWFGLVAPAGTPPAIVARLHDAAHKAMATSAFRQQAASISGVHMANSPAEFGQQIRAAIARYKRIAAQANIRIE
ncbi:tripartite tricarboxylate transporter substrate binding protein BugE [Schlegelella sp. S2-27]|uniref:Tripartite tricarboxylate transporter substrate binding protein BugE n=1 Tax=Caldimonas mangrovi TaxID=2944811 RepID=A0ABT0YR07_9BURK|nr:tripartite tricarboxylate transporter substrate binding protein BugE [Caldimonas mangrovi]MCM5680764.1 tripartite tricarboxylate transporter substrate binding protein BugE [Caldimonas mangrovi]